MFLFYMSNMAKYVSVLHLPAHDAELIDCEQCTLCVTVVPVEAISLSPCRTEKLPFL